MKKIIQKVLKELDSENPKLDYIRGLLEAVVEEPEEGVINPPLVPKYPILNNIPMPLDEAQILDAKAKSSIEEIKRLSELSSNE